MEKEFFDVFPNLKLKQELSELLEEVIVTKVACNAAKTCVRVYLRSDRWIHKKHIFSLDLNNESVQSYYTLCNSIIETLQKQLENENLSFDERKYIIDKMLEISKMMGEKDSENKKFIATLAIIGAAVVGGISAVLATTLGGNVRIEADDEDELL